MLSKCANPKCSARMKYMHDGTLHVVPRPAMHKYWRGDEGEFSAPPGRQIECFWLCDTCSRQMTITKDGELECKSALGQTRADRIVPSVVQQKTIDPLRNTALLISNWPPELSVGSSASAAVN